MNKNNAIRGLIVYAFYSASGNIVMMAALVILVGAFAVVTGSPALIGAFVGVGIVSLPSAILISAPKDSTSKWTKFRGAMPVKRKNIISSLYISNLLIAAVSILLSIAIIGLLKILHGDIMAEIDLFAFSPILVGAPLMACALFYPLVLTIGESKEEAVCIICVLGGAAAAAGIWWSANRLGEVIGYADGVGMVFSFAIPVVLIVLSYAVSVKIYAKKDL